MITQKINYLHHMEIQKISLSRHILFSENIPFSVELRFDVTTGYKLRTYGSTKRRSRILLWTSCLLGSISTSGLERSPVLNVILSDSILVDVDKMVSLNDIFSIKDFPPIPLGDTVPVVSVVKTSIQG